jgi:hypothetical protein
MRNKNWMFILVIILLLVVGCSNNNNSANKTLENIVTIKGYYEEPESLKDKQTIIINGVSAGEFVEIVIDGEITDFEHVKLEWDEKQSILLEKETLKRFDKLTNQTLVIKTYMPEGIPSEKVKWNSLSGKTYEYTIKEYSAKDAGNENGTVFYLE